MTRLRLGALCFGAALIAAAACSSNDSEPPAPGPAGEAGGQNLPTSGRAAGGVAGGGDGGAPLGNGGELPVAGEGGVAEGGTATAGAAHDPEGGASGDHNGGQAGDGPGGGGSDGGELVLFADSFDDETLETQGQYTANYVEFAHWDVSSGTVDVTVLPNGSIASPGRYGAGLPGERVVVDLNGSSNQDGTLETKQPVGLVAGVTYTLRYSLANAKNQTNSVTVSLGDWVHETRGFNAITPFTVYQTAFTPVTTASAKLVFESQGGSDGDGLLLDNVSITH